MKNAKMKGREAKTRNVPASSGASRRPTGGREPTAASIAIGWGRYPDMHHTDQLRGHTFRFTIPVMSAQTTTQ